MSDFWDRNKGSIMSGLATAGKQGYKGTKFVAKTGYKAGKQHYNSSKNKREGNSNNSSSSDLTISSPPPLTADVSNFPPPPVKPGQNQYHGSSRGGSGNVPPAATSRTSSTLPSSYSSEQNPIIPQIGNPQAVPYQVPAPVPQYTTADSQAPHIASRAATIVPGTQLPISSHPNNTAPATYNTRPVPLPHRAPDNNAAAGLVADPQLLSNTSLPRATRQLLTIDTASIATQNPNISQEAFAVPPANTMASPFPQTTHASYLAASQSPVQPESIASNKVSEPTPAVPAVPTRTYVRAPAALPVQPLPQEERQAMPQAMPQVMPQAMAQTSQPFPEENGVSDVQELKSPTSATTVKPYSWKDSEELKESLRIKIQNVDISSLPTPPVHRNRSESPSSETSSLRSKIKSRSQSPSGLKSPTQSTAVNLKTTETGKAMSTSRQTPQQTGRSSREGEGANNGIAGRYDSSVQVNFPPPPKPSRSETQTPANRDMRSSSSPPVKPTTAPRAPPRLPSRSVPSQPPVTSSVPKLSSTANGKADRENIKPKSAVSGAYNYDIKVDFQPPPKPFRKDKESSQQAPRSVPSFEKPSKYGPPPASNAETAQGRSIRAPPQIPSRAASLDPPPAYDSSHSHAPSAPPASNVELQSLSASSIQAGAEKTVKVAGSTIQIPKTKKAPPIKKALPGSLQALDTHKSNPEASAHLTEKGKKRPPKPAKKQSLMEQPNKTASNGGNSRGNFDQELEARLKSRSFHEKPAAVPSLVEHSNSFISSGKIKAAAPPVKPKIPIRLASNEALQPNEQAEVKDDSDGDNPFRRYLKNAVPSENDRLHKN